MLKKLYISLIAAAFCLSCAAQDNFLDNVRYDAKDEAIFNKVAAAVEPYKNEPSGALMVRIAKEFLGTEYVGGTMELEPEMLTINMDKTDCILFVEMCLALTRTVKSDDPSFEKFCRETQGLRYHDGIVDGYASRNHYTSSWIKQGEQNGIFQDISKELGGSPLDQHIDFMSTNLDSYKQLKDNPGMVVKIMKTEALLNKDSYYYLPQNDITNLTKGIKEGDIICYCTTVNGLDIGHVAIAVEQDGEMHFIHASTKAMKVIIDPKTIAGYVLAQKSTRGVRVIRIL